MYKKIVKECDDKLTIDNREFYVSRLKKKYDEAQILYRKKIERSQILVTKIRRLEKVKGRKKEKKIKRKKNKN